MPLFSYTATNNEGKKIVGQQEADSRDQIVQMLHDQSLVVISVEEKVEIDFKKLGSIQIGGVPLNEKVLFTKQLSTMLAAGLPVIQALDIIVQQTENDSLKEKLKKVYKSVESGSTLSDAFRKEETIFSELQINLLVAGEKSGQLNEVMEQIAIDLRKEKDLQSKIKGAMIYPVIIFIVMILVMVVMMLFMIPSVKDLYENFDAELPWITQALVTMSEGLSSPVGLISLVLVPIIIFFGFRYYYSTPSGRHVLDKLLLKIPVFGNLTTKVQLTQFNRLLSMLMKSGVPIVEALRIVAKSLSNIWFQELVMQASAEVTKGKSITIPLSKSKIFPVIMLKMLATGEETGKLDQITADMAEYYEKEVDDLTSNLTKLMEPFILLIVGGMVAFMAVAIYLPLYDLGQAANM